MHEHQQNMKGAIFMMVSMAGFVLNDTMIKLVSGDLLMFQTIFLRGVLATVLIALLAHNKGALTFRPTRRDLNIVGLRTFAEMGATFCFLSALFQMPLASVTAILQSLPLAVTLAAALFLGEKVGWRRYIAIILGFLGMILIIRPGTSGFSIHSLWALGAVGFVTLRELSTRKLSPETPSLYVALITSVVITVVAGVVSFTQEWQEVSTVNALYLSLAAVFILVAYIAGVAAMRYGEIAFVSPFRFSALIWAILLGLIVFKDVLDIWTISGSVVVVGTGVFTFYREQQTRRKINKG